MNARTAKLLTRYASRVGEKPRAVKREWHSFTRLEKGKRRVKMKAAVG